MVHGRTVRAVQRTHEQRFQAQLVVRRARRPACRPACPLPPPGGGPRQAWKVWDSRQSTLPHHPLAVPCTPPLLLLARHCADETCIPWYGAESEGTFNDCPHVSFLPTKPNPVCMEINDAGCALANVMTTIELEKSSACAASPSHPRSPPLAPAPPSKPPLPCHYHQPPKNCPTHSPFATATGTTTRYGTWIRTRLNPMSASTMRP